MPQLAGILMLVTQDLYPPVLGTAVSSTGHGVESIAPIVRCPGPSAHHSPVVPASAHIVTLSTRPGVDLSQPFPGSLEVTVTTVSSLPSGVLKWAVMLTVANRK